jgi:hypothetical protein
LDLGGLKNPSIEDVINGLKVGISLKVIIITSPLEACFEEWQVFPCPSL